MLNQCIFVLFDLLPRHLTLFNLLCKRQTVYRRTSLQNLRIGLIFRHVDAKALDTFGDMLAVVYGRAFEHVARDWQEHVVFRSQSDVIFEEFVVPGDELVIVFGFSLARLYRECDHVVAETNLRR